MMITEGNEQLCDMGDLFHELSKYSMDFVTNNYGEAEHMSSLFSNTLYYRIALVNNVIISAFGRSFETIYKHEICSDLTRFIRSGFYGDGISKLLRNTESSYLKLLGKPVELLFAGGHVYYNLKHYETKFTHYLASLPADKESEFYNTLFKAARLGRLND